MTKKFSHSKKRNTGLLYEFLIRHISGCLVEDKKGEALKATSLVKKYFSAGTLMHKELKIYKSILENKVKNNESASKIIKQAYLEARTIPFGKLDEEKSKLIKEINYSFSDKVYSYNVQNYPIYASIHVLLSDEMKKKPIIESVGKIKLEDSVINYLTRETDSLAEVIKIDPTYNDVVYKFVVNKFHEKYSNNLNESQRKLITKYVLSMISEDKLTFNSALNKEVKIVKENLRSINDDGIAKDSELTKKLTECYKKFVSINFDNVNEDKIVELLEYMGLISEMQSKN